LQEIIKKKEILNTQTLVIVFVIFGLKLYSNYC